MPKTPLLDVHSARTRYDVVWNFTPLFIFSTLRIFCIMMATTQGGGVCISLVGKQPNAFKMILKKMEKKLQYKKKIRQIFRKQFFLNFHQNWSKKNLGKNSSNKILCSGHSVSRSRTPYSQLVIRYHWLAFLNQVHKNLCPNL